MPDANALILGDSHVLGTFGQALAALLLQQDPSLVVASEGVQGSHVATWIQRLRSRGPAGWRLVIVVLGTNDYGIDPAAWGDQALELAARLQMLAPNARLVWVTAPILRVGDVSWQLWILDDLLPAPWTIVDSGPMTATLPMDADGIHRWAAGPAWAAAVVAALARLDTSSGGSSSSGIMVAAGVAIVGGVLALLASLGGRRRSRKQ
jgi:lysophospholipase L1-like esterase